ncbi:MAG TPA: serine/threonine-protein kinase [Myxococcales bacterium]|nr:serine/threonine-protein kinase [Myxococcales bacterium]
MESSPRQSDGFAAQNACENCGAPFTPVVTGQTRCDRCQGLLQPEPRSPLQEAEVAGFRLLRELGAGRFSHSWLAQDPASRPVVVKLLRRYAADPEAVRRFLEEAERLAAAPELAHPHVARPLAAGVHLVQALFLVYESGGEATLADELRQRGRVAPARALELCAQVCEGLAAAHRAGLLHRDLKPANVGLTRLDDGTEQAVVLDVATSHLLAGIGLRDDGMLPLSSAAYVSPEEAAGRRQDARSDLYSAGVLLFHVISGRLPVMGATAGELLRAHREQRPLRLREVGRRVHDDLETLVSRLLAKDPAHRPASGDEVALMMRALASIAECAPEDPAPAPEPLDDPLAVADLQEPDVPPPQMLPPAVDPGLERAMLGEVGPAPQAASPALTARKAFKLPAWCRPAITAAGALAAVVLALQLLHPPGEAPPAPPVAATAAAPAAGVSGATSRSPTPAAALETAAGRAAPLAMEPAPAAVQTAPKAVQAEPKAVQAAPKAAPAPSPWAKDFERAQKALWTDHPASAQVILRDVLKKRHLSRRDRARASKLMGDVEAKLGHRSGAAAWWRKSLQLYEDPEDRARVSQLLQAQR